MFYNNTERMITGRIVYRVENKLILTELCSVIPAVNNNYNK